MGFAADKTAGQCASALIVFITSSILVIVAAVRPKRIPIPKTSKAITFNFGYPPILGTIFLLLNGTITFPDVGNVVTGEAGVSPVTVVMLFMSFAFICASLDMTGVFAWMGIAITKFTNGSLTKVRPVLPSC